MVFEDLMCITVFVVAQVTWVQPRVLTFRQIAAVSGHIGYWLKSVESATRTLEQESSDVL